MKRLLFTILISIVGSNAFAAPGFAGSVNYGLEDYGDPKGGDNGVPWPFGLEQPIPWNGIQGLWEAEIDGWPRYFVMQTIGRSVTDRRLKVFEYDAMTCELISEGTGYEKRKVVVAGMLGDEGRFLYHIRAYKESDVKKIREEPGSAMFKDRMLLSISKAAWNRPAAKTAYSLSFVRQNPLFVCE
jgi:hypothetical protein